MQTLKTRLFICGLLLLNSTALASFETDDTIDGEQNCQKMDISRFGNTSAESLLGTLRAEYDPEQTETSEDLAVFSPGKNFTNDFSVSNDMITTRCHFKLVPLEDESNPPLSDTDHYTMDTKVELLLEGIVISGTGSNYPTYYVGDIEDDRVITSRSMRLRFYAGEIGDRKLLLRCDEEFSTKIINRSAKGIFNLFSFSTSETFRFCGLPSGP